MYIHKKGMQWKLHICRLMQLAVFRNLGGDHVTGHLIQWKSVIFVWGKTHDSAVVFRVKILNNTWFNSWCVVKQSEITYEQRLTS